MIDSSPKLRILQIIETGGPGGAETVFAQLSSGLKARGHQVVCLVRNGSWLPEELHRRGLEVHYLPSGRGSAAALVSMIHEFLKEQRFDLVHSHLFDGAMYAAIAARLNAKPIVATLHGQVDMRHLGMKQSIKRSVFRTLVTRCVTVSYALQRDLQPALRFPKDRQTVIHNGIEPIGAEVRVRPKPPVDIERVRILAVGNIRPAKDYPTLLHAVRALVDRGHDLSLDVAGQPDSSGLFDSLKQLRQSLGLEERVIFHGFVPDPTNLYLQADIFVLASSQEGFSLAVIEAMRHGTPVVSTRSGGPEEILEHGATGILVAPRDPIALADGLESLLCDAKLREHIRLNALRAVADQFGITRMVSDYESLYLSCVANLQRVRQPL